MSEIELLQSIDFKLEFIIGILILFVVLIAFYSVFKVFNFIFG